MPMPQTMVQKVFARTAGGTEARVGMELLIRPDRIMAYEWPGYLEKYIRQLEDRFGVQQVPDPDRYVIFIDHLVTRGDQEEAELRRETLEWARRNGINLHDQLGIGHQVSAELGYAVPGALVVHMDPHISGLGAFGALGIGLHHKLMEPWITGELVMTVPETVRVELTGRLADHTDGRDILHHLIRERGPDGFLGQVVEFSGPGVASLSLADRQSLCGMITFTGAESALMETDAIALGFISPVARTPIEPLTSDPGAAFAAEITLELGTVEPMVALPGGSTTEHMAAVSDVVGRPVQRGYIGSCSSGRFEDLAAAAQLLDGRSIAPGFQLILVPTSQAIRERADAEGITATLIAAGAEVAGSTCDHCFGYAQPLQDGEACISSGVLNVRGRMGSTRADIYLGSAQTVAASALEGAIADPRELAARVPVA